MAEKVIVKGGGTLDGAQFDNAATEATLRELIKTVKDTKCCGEGGDKKLQDLFSRALRENINGVNDSTTAHQDSTKEVGLLGKAAKTTGSLLTSGLSALAGGMISGVVTAGETLFKFFTDSLDAFRETSSVGASFNNDLVMMRKTAANAGMSLEDFTSMVGRNSKLMASLGGTTTKGAMAFAEMSGQIRSSEFGRNMQMTGMTTGDLNDYLSGYLEIQQRAGKIEGKIGEKERQGAEAYIEEMDKMTKMTGVSRQEGQNALRTAMKDGKALNLASKLSGQALLNFQAGLTLMNTTLDPSAMKSLSNMMSGVIDPGDRFAKMLMQASPGIMDFQQALGEGQLTAEQQVRGYKQQEKSIDGFLSKFSKEQIARDANLTQLREYQASLKRYKEMNYEDAVKEQAANNALTKAFASAGQIFQDIKGKILGAMLTSGVFDKFEKVIKKIADKFNEFAPQIGKFLSEFIDGIDNAISGPGSFMDGISAAFGSMFEKLTPIVKDLFKGLMEGVFGKSDKKKELEAKKSKVTQDAKSAGTLDDAAVKTELADLDAQLKSIDSSPFDNISKSLKEMFPVLEPIQDAIDGVSWAFKNWGWILGGLVVAGGVLALLSPVLKAAGAGLSAILIPIDLVAIAIGIGAGGLGFMFKQISAIIDSFVAGFKSIPGVLRELTELNSGKMKEVAAAMTSMAGPMIDLAKGGILAKFGGASGMGGVADSLLKFQSIDAATITGLIKPLTDFKATLSLYTSSGILDSFATGLGNFFKGDSGIGKLAESFKAFNDVKSDNIASLANGMIQMKTIGDDFSRQAAGINTFASSIKALDAAIKALNASLKEMSAPAASGGRGQPPGKSSLDTMATIGANTGGGAASEKLNTLVTELVALTKDIKESSKDQADALKGRKDAL